MQPDYTKNHVVIFENQLIMPPEISLCHLDPYAWYNKHRINHSSWKIADIDNSFNGNPFFSEEIPE